MLKCKVTATTVDNSVFSYECLTQSTTDAVDSAIDLFGVCKVKVVVLKPVR